MIDLDEAFALVERAARAGTGGAVMTAETPVHEDPYPSKIAMEAAVELEISAALGVVQTQTLGKVIQRAIDKALASTLPPPLK